jgi:hypothetical protein
MPNARENIAYRQRTVFSELASGVSINQCAVASARLTTADVCDDRVAMPPWRVNGRPERKTTTLMDR